MKPQHGGIYILGNHAPKRREIAGGDLDFSVRQAQADTQNHEIAVLHVFHAAGEDVGFDFRVRIQQQQKLSGTILEGPIVRSRETNVFIVIKYLHFSEVAQNLPRIIC